MRHPWIVADSLYGRDRNGFGVIVMAGPGGFSLVISTKLIDIACGRAACSYRRQPKGKNGYGLRADDGSLSQHW